MSMSRFIKCVTVGNGAVGKTCMLISYTSNTFTVDYVHMVFENFSVNMVVDGNTTNLSLWDIAGQEDYNSLSPLTYRGVDVFLLAFTVISKASYESIHSLLLDMLLHQRKLTASGFLFLAPFVYRPHLQNRAKMHERVAVIYTTKLLKNKNYLYSVLDRAWLVYHEFRS